MQRGIDAKLNSTSSHHALLSYHTTASDTTDLMMNIHEVKEYCIPIAEEL